VSEANLSPGPWDLSDLFSSFKAPELLQALDELEEQLQAFEALREELSDQMGAGAFARALNDYDAIVRGVSRLFAYASLRFSGDTQEQEAQVYLARFRQLAAETDNRTMFFQLWWKQLDDEAAAPLLTGAGDFRYWLESLRRQRPFTLTEPEEQVVNLKDVNGAAALLTLMSTITDRYTFKMTVDGREEELTRDQLSSYYQSPDPDLREAAYREMFRVYDQDRPVLGQMYQYRVRDWHSENVGLRGYATPISVRNLHNDLPGEVVDLLLEVCRDNTPLFQKYFRLKARWLGLDRLRRFDVYAPVAKTDRRYGFQEAVELVMDSYHRFDPGVADLARRVVSERHLDSEPRKGKRGGAFCATVSPELTPWIMQSYEGLPRDVATLAHELGHAVHSLLARHHSALTQHASLPLAETASTFGEMLVVDHLLATDPDPETRRALLFRQMDDNYATIMRQAYFALFEREAHDRIVAGAPIDELSDLYWQNLQEQFGDALEVDRIFNLEWITIPHIYRTPFYVYAYAFGQLLVLALYQQYLEEGERFRPRYLEILSAGGSDAPLTILERAGIEVDTRAFWQGGFDVLGESLARLEALPIPVQ
jgi:oligoendopeptidase F